MRRDEERIDTTQSLRKVLRTNIRGKRKTKNKMERCMPMGEEMDMGKWSRKIISHAGDTI